MATAFATRLIRALLISKTTLIATTYVSRMTNVLGTLITMPTKTVYAVAVSAKVILIPTQQFGGQTGYLPVPVTAPNV
jgi:hypothetical protein